MAIRVVLAEDNYLLREGVRRLIEAQPELELAAACGDLHSLVAAIEETKPDVVITDIRMPPTGTDEGLQAAERARALDPAVGVILLSQYADPEYALAFLEGGSRGRAYLLKERVSDIAQLLTVIKEVTKGGSYVDPEVVDALVRTRVRNASSPILRLTPREREILAEMAQGKNNQAIAESLVLSERAVEKHISSIFSKLGLSEEPDIHRRVKAVLLFLADREG